MKIKKLVKTAIKVLDSDDWSRKKKLKLMSKTLDKLRAYEVKLKDELASANSAEDIERLNRRIKLTQDQTRKAQVMCENLQSEADS